MSNRSIKKHFSQSAQYYDQHAAVHRTIADKLISLCPKAVEANNVLEIGCGSGFLTSQLATRFPNARITAIDISEKMIDLAKRRITAANRVTFICTDAEHFDYPENYDLVVSSSVFQWISNLQSLFSKIRQCTETGSRIIISLMIDGTFKELHSLRSALYPLKPVLRALPKLIDVIEILQASGFKIEHREEQEYIENYSDAWVFFKTIKSLGFTGGDISTSTVALNKQELKKLAEEYNNVWTKEEKVIATYKVGFISVKFG